MRRLRISVAGLMAGVCLAWAVPAASLPEPVAGGVFPAEPESDPRYTAAAVAATAAHIPARLVVCSAGGIAGFVAGVLLRLPIWIVTLGDRGGSTEVFDRVGSTIVERACEGPWIITPERVRELAATPPSTGAGAAGGESGVAVPDGER